MSLVRAGTDTGTTWFVLSRWILESSDGEERGKSFETHRYKKYQNQLRSTSKRSRRAAKSKKVTINAINECPSIHLR